MVSSLAVSLLDASRTIGARAAAAATDDPLRLELPPDGGGDGELTPEVAAVLGTLYLLSELDAIDLVASAELLADERWGLDLRDETAAQALESFAAGRQRWPRPAQRDALFARLFGVSQGSTDSAPAMASPNSAFEELLAGYALAIGDHVDRPGPGATRGLRSAGGRLRANLAPRQYGNTLVIAEALTDQVRAAVDVLGQRGIGALFGVTGMWAVLRAMAGNEAPDVGRHVDRGTAGAALIGSIGYPSVPDLVDRVLVDAAITWSAATGFEIGER